MVPAGKTPLKFILMRILVWLSVALSGAAMVALHMRLDHTIGENLEFHRQSALLPSVQAVELVAGGFNKLAADIYWLGFIQYCGEMTEQRGEPFARAYDYLNLVTGLDPTFTKPYWFGCWAVGYWQKRPDLADKILQRGIAANPTSWDLPYLAGVNQFMFVHDYKAAAKYYRLGAGKPGAPEFLVRRAEVFESNLPVLQKRFRTLLAMYYGDKSIRNDPRMKYTLYRELQSLLQEEYRVAPDDKQRQIIKAKMTEIKEDFEKAED
jgi:hypothetical protein